MAEKREDSILKAFVKVAIVFFVDYLVNIIWSVIATAIYVAVIYSVGRAGLGASELMDTLTKSPGYLFAVSAYNLLIIFIVRLFWRYSDKKDPGIMGLGWKRNSLKLFSIGIAGGTVEMLLIILVSLAAGTLWFQSSGLAIFTTQEILKSLFFGILTFVLVGFGEETLFRGYIQKRLMLVIGRGWALLISSLVFTAAHLFTYAKPLDFIDIALGGVVMGYLYMLTDSLYLPAGYHFMFDFIQVNIAKLQEYEYYKGAVMFIFNNSGDLVISKVNFGNIVEVSFVAVELMLLALFYIFRDKIKDLKALN
ncbi:MAG: lysostaphin resistance A-like protein [Caulobacteraceae bacterium]